MSLFRFGPLPVIAGTMSVMLLAGCPNAGTQPPVGNGSTPPSTTTPNNGGASGNNNGGTTPSAAPTSNAPAPTTAAATLRGKVYDETGAVVNNAKVRVRSLNAATTFDTTVDVTGGSYVVNSVPTGVQVEVTASREGWTTRSRVEALLPESASVTNVVNFGGPNNDSSDPEGAAFFISDFPEISGARVADSSVTAGTKLAYVVTFSEPLNTDNRELAEDAFLVSQSGRGVFIERGTFFLDRDNDAEITWNEAGTEMTFTLNAPLWADNDDETQYLVYMRRPSGDALIKDAGGKVLGFNANLAEGSNYQAFKRSNLVLSSTDNTPATRWTATHTDVASFDVAEDETDPSITSIAVQGDNRIILTYSEPMVAVGAEVGGAATVASNGVVDLENYSFMVAEDLSDIEGEEWQSGDVSAFAGNWGDITENTGAFRFTTANASIEVSKTDPKVIRILAVGNNTFANALKAIKVRVDSDVQDPAGNGVRTTNDENFKSAEF